MRSLNDFTIPIDQRGIMEVNGQPMDVQEDLGFLQLLFPWEAFYQMNLQTEKNRNGKIGLKLSDNTKNNMTE